MESFTLSNLLIPVRHEVLARFPLYCQVQPLKRPRMKWHVKGVYQPLDNQKELRHALTAYEQLRIDVPCIIDTYINLERAKSCKLAFPTGRLHGDEDNLRKAINDALIDREIVTDDKLILGGTNFKLFGSENECLVIIWSVHPTLTETIHV